MPRTTAIKEDPDQIKREEQVDMSAIPATGDTTDDEQDSGYAKPQKASLTEEEEERFADLPEGYPKLNDPEWTKARRLKHFEKNMLLTLRSDREKFFHGRKNDASHHRGSVPDCISNHEGECAFSKENHDTIFGYPDGNTSRRTRSSEQRVLDHVLSPAFQSFFSKVIRTGIPDCGMGTQNSANDDGSDTGVEDYVWAEDLPDEHWSYCEATLPPNLKDRIEGDGPPRKRNAKTKIEFCGNLIPTRLKDPNRRLDLTALLTRQPKPTQTDRSQDTLRSKEQAEAGPWDKAYRPSVCGPRHAHKCHRTLANAQRQNETISGLEPKQRPLDFTTTPLASEVSNMTPHKQERVSINFPKDWIYSTYGEDYAKSMTLPRCYITGELEPNFESKMGTTLGRQDWLASEVATLFETNVKGNGLFIEGEFQALKFNKDHPDLQRTRETCAQEGCSEEVSRIVGLKNKHPFRATLENGESGVTCGFEHHAQVQTYVERARSDRAYEQWARSVASISDFASLSGSSKHSRKDWKTLLDLGILPEPGAPSGTGNKSYGEHIRAKKRSRHGSLEENSLSWSPMSSGTAYAVSEVGSANYRPATLRVPSQSTGYASDATSPYGKRYAPFEDDDYEGDGFGN